jgi:hypothetical protein
MISIDRLEWVPTGTGELTGATFKLLRTSVKPFIANP